MFNPHKLILPRGKKKKDWRDYLSKLTELQVERAEI